MCLRTNISPKVNSNISFLSFSHQLVEYTFTSPKLHVAEREWRWLYLILFSLACTLVINLRCMVLKIYMGALLDLFFYKRKNVTQRISVIRNIDIIFHDFPFLFSFFHLAPGATCSMHSIEPWNQNVLTNQFSFLIHQWIRCMVKSN